MTSMYSPQDVLKDVWWIGLVAFGVSLILTPIMRFVAYRTKIVDRPDDLLKPHAKPIAYLGGVAIFFGLIVGLGAFLSTVPDKAAQWSQLGDALSQFQIGQLIRNPFWNTFAIAAGCLIIMLTGLLDDLFDIKPRTKVIAQIAAAVILVIGGVGHELAPVILKPFGIPLPPKWIQVAISTVGCMVVVIAICNATNLLDGLDGLCGGVMGIVALGFLALAVHLAMYHNIVDRHTDTIRVGLCLAMAGAALGFLPYNIPPASIFMGDAGSMLLGFFVSAMMMLFCQEGNGRWFVAACAVFALPIIDTGLAVVRRVLTGKRIFEGDRSHLYDQLVDRGMTVRQVVVLFYIMAIISATGGVLAAIYLRGRWAVATYAVIAVVLVIVFVKLGMVKPHPHEKKSAEAQDTEQ
ncbi:MAG: undecaprenyl/decaprenyl-phosphate alpha-N-acetylglucosaminyl 1-phosphate transferase [Phycisphaerae bacterium]|nr:undecaprenyl/decaprenyl-phosphate alpha-N-acetylglucosaminyl 1-phosphate transferase [Phycisphaerae bacterium]